MVKKDLISTEDLSSTDLKHYLNLAKRIDQIPNKEKGTLLQGHVMGVMFFEPSTRTRLSFEAAMSRLGGSYIGLLDIINTSVVKGETFADTVHIVEQYADLLVIRHPKEGAARHAAEISKVPIVNAGDGANQHPTQMLLDLYTIKKFFKRLDNLNIALVGDLRYSRTIHSLFKALVRFENLKITLVSPNILRMPDYLTNEETAKEVTFHETSILEDAISTCDIIYMTRIQKERFPDLLEYEKVKNSYCINKKSLQGAQKQLKILHPLPRVDEIHPDVDDTPYAGYFEQAGNGLIMRQAILCDLLGMTL